MGQSCSAFKKQVTNGTASCSSANSMCCNIDLHTASCGVSSKGPCTPPLQATVEVAMCAGCK